MGGIRSLAVLAALGVFAALAPAAAAQPRFRFPAPPPKDAPVVVGPTEAGTRLLAFDRRGKLCLALLTRSEGRHESVPECERPSGVLREAGFSSSYDGRARQMVHSGVVAPEVAEVEVVFRGGGSVRGPAHEGEAYRGRYAGKVRFVALEARGRYAQVDTSYVKLYGADGSLLGVVDHYFADAERVGRPVRLVRGATGGTPWSLRAFRQRVLSPLIGHEERFVVQSCVEISRRGRRGRSRSVTQACMDPDFTRDRDSFMSEQSCDRLGLAAVGTVAPDVGAVVAVLGDGRRRHLRLRPVPARHGDRRAFALVLGPRVAIRRIVAIAEGGRKRALTRDIGPGATRCGEDGGFFGLLAYDATPPSGPLGLTVYDDGVLLCSTLGTPTRSLAECGHPPLNPFDEEILVRRRGGRGLVAGVLPGYVRSAVVELDDGRRIRLETTTDGPYSGRYAGLVRFFTLDFDPRRSIAAVTLYDDRGRRTNRFLGVEEPRRIGRAQLVVPGPPGLRLRAGWHGVPHDPRAFLCAWIGGGAGCGFATTWGVAVEASCNPRRLVLWGMLPKGRDAVTIETDRGDLAARIGRLPRALRKRPSQLPRWQRRDAEVAAFVAAVPGNARPTALVMSGRRPLRQRLALPSAAAQCGYGDLISVG